MNCQSALGPKVGQSASPIMIPRADVGHQKPLRAVTEWKTSFSFGKPSTVALSLGGIRNSIESTGIWRTG